MRIVLLTVVLALGLSASAQACSCATPSGDPQAEIAESDAAVHGKVVKRTVKGGSVVGNVTYRLRVLSDYKGNVGRFVSFKTTLQSAACGLDLRRGSRIALLLHRADGRYQGSLCGVRSKEYFEGDAKASAACAQALA